jgi:3-phytase
MRIHVALYAAAIAVAFVAQANEPATVQPVRETPPVGVPEDAADDPAIITGSTPADTRIIGTQKKGGLYVYDLDGKVVQEILSGRPNNVDMRAGFAWPDGEGAVVATSDRSDNTVALYRFDPATKQLDPNARMRIPTGFVEVYGVAIGRLNDAFVVVATSKTGDVAQWTLALQDGAIKADRTRAFALGSITEGAVIDDETRTLYLSQELVGLWRVPLDPAQGDKPEPVDVIAPNGNLAPDVEGVAIWRGPGTTGYLIVSAQGESRFNVYDREAPHRFRGTFRIVDNPNAGVDGVTTTDGLEATSAPLGPDFPRGLLVVQDDLNTQPDATQDFKYVSWADVETALGLRPQAAQ